MGLNLCIGYTGLVSFGHGAWFGLGAYAAALAQRHWFSASIVWPALFALAFLLVASMLIGFLVLRRRGVYFSLLTLAFSALTYAVAFRWTAFTGGENGLGGVTRAVWLGVDLANPWVYYAIVAAFGVFTVYALSRFHASPLGTVLPDSRERQRAQFVGYATQRYKRSLYGLRDPHRARRRAFAFHHRFASAPTAISFSGSSGV
jgi:ABC-type branched-subunit amino acid transport system permease subunit